MTVFMDNPYTFVTVTAFAVWLWVNYIQHIAWAIGLTTLAIVAGLIGWALTGAGIPWAAMDLSEKAIHLCGIVLMLTSFCSALYAVISWDEGLAAIKARKRSR